MAFRIDQLAVYNLATVGNSVTAGSFVKSGGTASQFLKADGSVDATAYLNANEDSEQTVGGRVHYFNDGVKRMNIDPRWNESGYDADLGTLHIWAWTAGGAAYGRAGIALYNGSAYQYLTTKASTTGMFINNTQVVTNSGTWSINVSGSAGSLSSMNISQFTNNSGYITSAANWFGAETTGGTADWNHVTNTRPGTGYTLLLGSNSNGFGVGNYYHAFNLEYASKTGGGNVTQLAISYGTPGNDIRMRGRYDGTWSSWVTFINSSNIGSYALTSLPAHNHDGSAITTGTVANARTTASSSNGSSTIVQRDSNGYFDTEGIGINKYLYMGGYRTFSIGSVYADGTQAKRWEIARIGIDYNDWNSVGTFEVELHEGYFSTGLKKVYNIWYGYVSNSGIRLVEQRGAGSNNFKVVIGSEVVVSGDHRYLPVYVDVAYYSSCHVVIKTNRSVTGNSNSAVGATYIFTSPSSTNISFSVDETVEFTTHSSASVPGNFQTTSGSSFLRVSGISSGSYIELSGNLPGHTNGVYPTIKSGGTIHFANNGKYSAYLEGNNTYFGILNSGSSTTVLLNTNGNSYFTGGNLGVGLSNPGATLHVGGTSYIGTMTAYYPAVHIRGAYYGGPRLQVYGLDADSTAWMGLGTDMSGNPFELSVYYPTNGASSVSFGRYSYTTGAQYSGYTTTARLSHGGTWTVLGDVVAYGSPSDARLKTVKEVVPNALEKVMKLSGYRFDWNKVDDLTRIKEDVGVVAQEVAQVLPELARTNDDGYMSVRYQGLTAVLIEAVKEQQKQIEELKTKLNAVTK
jgi:hypothetical protein